MRSQVAELSTSAFKKHVSDTVFTAAEWEAEFFDDCGGREGFLKVFTPILCMQVFEDPKLNVTLDFARQKNEDLSIYDVTVDTRDMQEAILCALSTNPCSDATLIREGVQVNALEYLTGLVFSEVRKFIEK